METGRQSVCPDWSIHQSIIQDNQQLFPPADIGLMLPVGLDQHTVVSTVELIS